jgi:hypothetical protein
MSPNPIQKVGPIAVALSNPDEKDLLLAQQEA